MCPRPPQDTGVEVPSQQHLPSALVLVCLDCHVWESTDAGARQGSQGTWGPIWPAWDRPGEHGQSGQPTGDAWEEASSHFQKDMGDSGSFPPGRRWVGIC